MQCIKVQDHFHTTLNFHNDFKEFFVKVFWKEVSSAEQLPCCLATVPRCMPRFHLIDYTVTHYLLLLHATCDVLSLFDLSGKMLYFTKSETGLYRISNDKNNNIWSQQPQTGEKSD